MEIAINKSKTLLKHSSIILFLIVFINAGLILSIGLISNQSSLKRILLVKSPIANDNKAGIVPDLKLSTNSNKMTDLTQAGQNTEMYFEYNR